MSDEEHATSGFERHAQTIISAVVLALLAWTGTTLLDVRERLTRIEAIKLSEVANDQRLNAELAGIRDRLHVVELQLAKNSK
jgi:hypothetical protein